METPLLEIRNATKVYGGGLFGRGEKLVALQDFNLTIAESPVTITAIAGESGSGKTTLANAVLGFVSLSSRSDPLSRHGHCPPYRGQRRDYRRRGPGVFQDPYEVYNPFYRVKHIFDMVVENLGPVGQPKRDQPSHRGRAAHGGAARRRSRWKSIRTS